MKGALRLYWFNIAWSLSMVGVGIYLTLSYGFDVGMIPFALALMMCIPVFFYIWDSLRGMQ